MNQQILDRLHQTQIELLDVLDAYCRANNLTYALAFGTLLGGCTA